MSSAFLVRGNVPAVVTPFDANGEIRWDDVAALVRWHLDRGADGICMAGDNGESWTLSIDERRRLAEVAVRTVARRVPVVMGASGVTAKQSIAYAQAAAEAGVDAIMVGPQSYVMKATTAELVARMTAIHRAVPLPIVLYDSPRRTNVSLTIDTMRAITDAVQVVGLKEASRDYFYLTHVIRHFGQRLAVLVGPAPFIVPGLQLGAAGFISSGPELFGAALAPLRDADRVAPSTALRDLHYRLTRVYETLMALGTWPAALKAALVYVGAPAGVPREPVMPLERTALAELHRVLEECGIAAAGTTAPQRVAA